MAIAEPTTAPIPSDAREVDPTVDVSIVIVNYRTRDLVVRCVQSVVEQTVGVTYELVIVDNDVNETGPWPADVLDAGEVRSFGENLGFARAVNLGAAGARGRYVLLLNPDTVVVDGAIQELVAFADRHPERALYGGRTIDANGELDPRSCWAFPTMWSTFCFALGLTSVAKGNRWLDRESMGRWRRDSVRPVDVVTGCLCLVDRDAWAQLDGFDERFFVYGEDVDLALRARDAGFRPLLYPGATVIHDVGQASATRGDKLVLLHRGKVSVLRKHWRPLAATVGVWLLRAGVALRAAVRRDSWPELHRRRAEWVHGHEGAR